jgi:hypothetical protein
VNFEDFVRELEALGIDEVKRRLLNGQYSKISLKRDIAKDWLNGKQMEQLREREARTDAIATQASEAAERAAEAATEQAKQARRANVIAIVALIVSLAAAGMSLYTFFHSVPANTQHSAGP